MAPAELAELAETDPSVLVANEDDMARALASALAYGGRNTIGSGVRHRRQMRPAGLCRVLSRLVRAGKNQRVFTVSINTSETALDSPQGVVATMCVNRQRESRARVSRATPQPAAAAGGCDGGT